MWINISVKFSSRKITLCFAYVILFCINNDWLWLMTDWSVGVEIKMTLVMTWKSFPTPPPPPPLWEKFTVTDGLRSQNSALQWCHNERDGVSNHQHHDDILHCLFRRWSMKTSKPRVTGLCEGNSPVTGEFTAQRASNAESGSICDVIIPVMRSFGIFFVTSLNKLFDKQ